MSTTIKRGTIVKITTSHLEGPRKAKVSSKKKNGWLRCSWLSPQVMVGEMFNVRNSPSEVNIWESSDDTMFKTPERIRIIPREMKGHPSQPELRLNENGASALDYII